MPSILDTLTAARAKYGERLTPAQAIELLKAVVAGNPEYGLLRKTTGNHWQGFALDIIAHKGGDQHYDALIDAPDASSKPPYNGTARPAWQAKGPYDASRFVPIPGTSVPNPGTPDPPATEPPKPQPCSECAALKSQFTAWASAFGLQLAGIQRSLDDLSKQPPSAVTFPKYVGRVNIKYLGSAPAELEPEQ